jgi:hypothetical protein
MLSGEPQKKILRFESTEAVVVHFVDPKFAATFAVSVDREGDRVDCLLRVVWSRMIELFQVSQTVQTNYIARGSIKSRCPNRNIVKSRYPVVNANARSF